MQRARALSPYHAPASKIPAGTLRLGEHILKRIPALTGIAASALLHSALAADAAAWEMKINNKGEFFALQTLPEAAVSIRKTAKNTWLLAYSATQGRPRALKGLSIGKRNLLRCGRYSRAQKSRKCLQVNKSLLGMLLDDKDTQALARAREMTIFTDGPATSTSFGLNGISATITQLNVAYTGTVKGVEKGRITQPKTAESRECVKVQARTGWQQFRLRRAVRSVASVGGGWTVDKARYRPVRALGHTGPAAKQLAPYNSYKFDQAYPFGALLIEHRGRAMHINAGKRLPARAKLVSLRINDTGLGDNSGFLDVCFR